MLVRLKAVNHLKEIVEKPQYNDWVEVLSAFTIKAFQPSNVSMKIIMWKAPS
jgi:hypothetical protein